MSENVAVQERVILVPRRRKKMISLYLDDETLAALRETVRMGIYPNMSAAIRDAIKNIGPDGIA
jgi:hypothetical protein